MNVIELIEQEYFKIWFHPTNGKQSTMEEQSKLRSELLHLANLGDALISQRDELEHLTKEHGFYCLQGLLMLIKDGNDNAKKD